MATAGGLEIHQQIAHGAPEVKAAYESGPADDAAQVPSLASVPRAERDPRAIVAMERPRRESKLTAVPAVAFAILAVLIAGVASALVRNNQSTSTPLAMIQASADTTAGAKTAQISATVKTASGPLANGISVAGGFDFGNRRASLVVDPSKFGLTGVGKIEAIADYSSGFVMYMKFPSELSSQLGGKPWLKIDLASLLKQEGVDVDLGALTQGQSNDPTSGLQMLRGADSVVTVGTEDIRGTQTTHYRLVIDIEKAIAAAPASTRDAMTKLANLYTVKTFPMDVWLDSQGRVNRFQQTIDPSTIHLPAGVSAQNNPFAAGPITMTYDMYDFGAPVDVQVPPADQTTDLSQLLKNGGN